MLTIPVLFGISVLTYGIINFAPGDPVTALLNPEQMALLGPEWVEQRKDALGLNEPLPVRYGLWLREVVQGNLGYSYRDSEPVTDKVIERIGPTLRLMVTAQLIALLIGIPLGILSAIRQYSVLDYLVTVLGFTAAALPPFFLALGLIYIFSLRFPVLPSSGMNTVGEKATLSDSIQHLILPAMALGLAYAAPLIRYSRSSMLETIRQDYVAVARSKGLSEKVVILRHALRNSLIPLVTVVALGLPALLGGTVIVEQVFAWPGMGTLAISAVFGRDYPVIMGITLIGSVMVLISNLLADILYAIVDPRIRYS
jgi:peptide/nickel transport system permease protein